VSHVPVGAAGTNEATLFLAQRRGHVFLLFGALVSAVCTLLFLTIAERALPEARFSQLAAMWTASFLMSSGLLLPVEQELSRSLAVWRRGRADASKTVLSAAAVQVGLVAVCCVMAVLVSRRAGPLNSSGAAVCVIIGVVGLGTAHLVRGALTGSGAFAGVAVLQVVDGLGRVILAWLFLVFWSAPSWTLLTLIGLPPLIASACAAPALRKRGNLPATGGDGVATRSIEPFERGFARNTMALIPSTLLAAVLLGGPTIVMGWVERDPAAPAATHFFIVMTLVRVPVFFSQAAFAAALPAVAVALMGGSNVRVDAIRRGMAATALAVLVVVAGSSAVVGPVISRVALREDVGFALFLLGGAGIACYIVGLGSTMLAVASGAHGATTLGWLFGFVAFAALVSANPVPQMVPPAFLLATALLAGHSLLRAERSVDAIGHRTLQ
jgi:hypothetical protein